MRTLRERSIRRLLHLVYRNWPAHFQKATNIDFSLDKDRSYYENIILCGMGGSATACDIINNLMQYCGSIPSLVVRGQKLPPFVKEESLVIINSVSGNTVEALNMAKEASDRKAEVICTSSGGN